jgi:hypothetical protein
MYESIGTGDIIDDAMTTAKLSLDSVYIIWSEQDSDIMFKRNAISFDPTINLSNTTGKSSGPAMAAFENNVYVVWTDESPGYSGIRYRKSTDGGASFGRNMLLDPYYGSFAAVAVSGNNVYVVYNSPVTGNSEILYKKSTNGGDSFGGTVNISNTTENSYSPRVAASNNLSL